jgi:hypothetical protein
MFIKSIAPFALCLALATPSLATAQVAPSAAAGVQQTPAGAAKPATSVVKHYDPDEVICRYTAVTGTRFPTKACHRRADWDQMAQDSKDELNHQTSLGVKSQPGG